MHVAFVVSIVFTFCYGAVAHIDDVDEDKDLQFENSSIQQHLNQECLPYQKPVDCAEIYENGFEKSGVYEVYPKNRNIGCSSFKVYCDMETDGGGWTVIQRRGDFKRPIDYFYKTWNEYKNGFGSLKRDFWLGNDYIHALTNQKKYSVRFDLGTDNETAYAFYDSFWTEDETYKYKLHITDYSGTAGDSMSYHNNSTFSTKDQQGSTSCASQFKGGWWYNSCYETNLNGNDFIHALTYQKKYAVRFDLGTDNETAYAVYDNFWIENEYYKYKLHITDYIGTAGVSMSYHNTMRFSTKDQLWKRKCPIQRKGG